MEIPWTDYVKPELAVLLPVLWLLGFAIKKSKYKDEIIPIVLFIVGMLLSALYIFATEPLATAQQWAMAAFVAITQGALYAGFAIGGNQLIRQTPRLLDIKKDNE